MSLNSPDAYLNINNANLRVFGNVHTNQVHLGNMTVRPSYGLSTVTDVSNTTPDTIQFTNTHTAFTTTGNVTVGKDLTVSGNVEVGTANLFVDTVNSRIGVGTTEPSGQLELAGDSTIQEYPPGPMDDYETLIPGHGVFCAYAGDASAYSGSPHFYHAWKAFDDTSDFYHGGNRYTGTDRAYVGSIQLHGQSIIGDYIVLEMPYQIKVQSVTLGDQSTRMAKDFTIVGSNDGVTWTTIRSVTDAVFSSTQQNFSLNATEYFSKLAIIVTKLQNDSYWNHRHIRYFGTPGPTTLDKGSLTLGRTLDVPRISRYDVDTETPRPEKLVLDFDTIVNSSPTDISGKGNHGTLVGATYSPADKAFSFDASTDKINGNVSGHNTASGAQFTITLWAKVIGGPNVDILFNTSGGTGTQRAFVYYPGTDFRLAFNGGRREWNPPSDISNGKWFMMTVTHAGSRATSKCYVDGKELTFKADQGSVDTSALPSGAPFYIISDANATSSTPVYISNLKMYDVALEPSEIKKLYRLGRTGRSMVITDTAVGIGKTPEAQLDVRGTFKTSDMSVDGEAITFYNNNKGGTSNDGDDYAASALLNDYSAWTSIFKKSWIGGGSGWGTFWAGNNGALYRRESGDINPNEYVFVGAGTKRFTFELNNGHAYFDAGLSQNAYDYAEYFEWEDGNPHNEDRRGYSVVLGENGKIKKATSDDEPTDIFGIVSGTSGIVGDAACYDWQGKYEVDEWGTRATDEVYQLSWTTEDGKNHNYDEDRVPEGVIVPENVSRRLYNRERITPDYDDTKQYIPRDKRKEWCTVGLLGKVRLRDGSPKNPNWRYLKTIAGKELWLIR